MSSTNITTVVGAQFVRDQLINFLPKEMTAVFRRTVTKLASDGRAAMRRRAPKRSGRLRKAIKSRRMKGKRDLMGAGIYIEHGKGAKNDAFYWHMVAFGTDHSAGQDFITPTVDELRQNHSAEMERVFSSQILRQLEKRGAAQARRVA